MMPPVAALFSWSVGMTKPKTVHGNGSPATTNSLSSPVPPSWSQVSQLCEPSRVLVWIQLVPGGGATLTS